MGELDLTYKTISIYEPADELVVTHEESTETAIPEYCQDLARIIDATGQVRLRDKALSDGKLTISGTIRVTVLYTSEESPGLRSLTLSLPFSCKADEKRSLDHITVDCKLLMLDVRMLGARKIYIRALPEFRVRGYQKADFRLATGCACDDSIELLHRRLTLPVLSNIVTHEFSFAQEISPEEGESSVEELLMDRIYLQVDESQLFGNKLVIKGHAVLSLLFRGEDQTLGSRELTLPFSQIIDGRDISEDAQLYCTASVTEQDIHLIRTEYGTGFGVSLRLALLVRACHTYELDYVADLYSTAYETTATLENMQLPIERSPESISRVASQRLEGTEGFVYLTDTSLSQPEMAAGEDGQTSLRCTLRQKVLSTDESGAPVITERSSEISANLGKTPSSIQAYTEPEKWQRLGDGYELRTPVVFSLRFAEDQQISVVTAAQSQEEIDRTKLPSLILRRLRAGETLWMIAKQYKTIEQTILEANDLADESGLTGQMLLIPKQR